MQSYYNFRTFDVAEDGLFGNCENCRRYNDKDCPNKSIIFNEKLLADATEIYKEKYTCNVQKFRG